MERTVLAQSGKAVDYLIKSSIDFQKILIDVQFQALHSSRQSTIRCPTVQM